MPGAADLPRTPFSDFLESRVQAMLKKTKDDEIARLRALGDSETVPETAEGLTIRQV